MIAELPRLQRGLVKGTSRVAITASSMPDVVRRRRQSRGPEALEAQADMFEREADKLAAKLTPEQLQSPAVPRDVAERLMPYDPRRQRQAIDDLRKSARELREIAAQRRGDDVA